MKKLLLILVLPLVAFQAKAQTWGTLNVDTLVTMNTSSPGTAITAAIGNAGTVCGGDCTVGKTVTWGGEPAGGTPAGFTVGANQGACSNLGAVQMTGGGALYAAQSLNYYSAAHNDADDGTDASLNFSGTPGNATVVSALTCVKLGPPSQKNGNDWDILGMFSVVGNYAVAQLNSNCSATGSYGIRIEVKPTAHSPCITISPQGTYYVNIATNFTTGYTAMWVWTAAGTLVGNVNVTAGDTGGSLYFVFMGNNEAGANSGTTTYFQNLLVNFSSASTSAPLFWSQIAQVLVPNVVGETQSAASTAITSAGLVVGTVTMQSSSTVPSGDVVSESPSASTSVNLGSSVNLVLSSGPAQVLVPNVVGETQSAASTAITSVGLVVGTVTMQSSSTVPSGDVISESPSASTSVNVGSSVNLVLSSGPAQVLVPNVAGDAQSAASTTIASVGLVVGTVTMQSSGTVPSGDVVSESPSASTSVNVGSSVNLVLSSGPAQVLVPNVAGDAQSAASTAITSAGLVVGTVTMQSSSTVPSGDVISENPSASTSVIVGSSVNLLLSSGPAACSVTDTSDDPNDTGSLRHCVSNLASGGTITFASGLNGTITLTSPLPALNGQITITGPGANLLTISGGNAVPVFNITAGTVSISGLTVAEGNGINGGGIYNGGTLTLSNSTISGNTTTGTGGGIYNGGTLTVIDSTISGNTTTGTGGGIVNSGTLTVDNSTISGNTAGTSGSGIFSSGGTLTLSNSIVAGNTTANEPGGDCDGCGTQSQYNLINTTGTSPAINPLLAPLGNYGGVAQTMLPLPGSPAICAASSALIPAGVTTDQRGLPNSTTYNSTACYDLGAVQTNYALSFTTDPPSTGTLPGAVLSPAPAVVVTESGNALTGGSASVSATDANSDLTTSPVTATTSTSNGQAAFSTMIFTGNTSNDTLTATLPLNPSLNTPLSITTQSTGFSVGEQVIVTIGASAAGLSFSINGTDYTTTQTPSLIAGNSYTLATTSPQTIAATPGVEYIFSNWSDGTLTLADSLTPDTSTTSDVAMFNPLYQLTVVAGSGGTIAATTAPSGFYNFQTMQTITATPNAGYYFSGWTGANSPGDIASATSASTTVTMNGAENIIANFAPIPGYQVATLNDDATGSAGNCSSPSSSCTLRDAITAAESNNGAAGYITFASGLNGAITLTSPLPALNGQITITGPGANLLTISGGNAVPVFNITSGTVSISGLTVAGGNGINGGGIVNSGTLTLSNSTISGNTAGSSGGGIYNGGTLTVIDSTISGNTTTGTGGGIVNSGTLTVDNSTISGNTAGTSGSGIFSSGGALTVSNSIVAGNTTPNEPGDDCDGCGTQSPYNLINTTGTSPAINPLLAPLGSYGGVAQTMLPLPGSPAICAASSALIPAGVTTDQRGLPNSTTYNSTTCYDLGAVQTDYALSFTTDPPLSGTLPGAVLSPAPAVVVTESGNALTGGSASVSATDANSDLTTSPVTATTSTSNGQAAFSTMIFTGNTSNDTLTATLPLNPSLNTPLSITTQSTGFSVGASTVPPAITSAASTTFTTGTTGTFTVTATGSPAPTFSETGTLPSGLSFNSKTGVLSGTAAAGTGGTYSITFTASNGTSPNAVQSFTLTVDQAPAITSVPSAVFVLGTPGSFALTATGFPTPALSLTSGTLPSGITFNAATDVLSGTPGTGTSGTYALQFTAGNGVGSNVVQSFTLTVDQAPAITSAAAATFTTGTAGSFTVKASGYPAPTFSETGTLPSGLSFNSTTGVLSGTAAAGTGGTYGITFTASNGTSPNAVQSFTLTVDQAPAITSAAAATFTTGTAGSFTVKASGYPAPTFSETGALPKGVTFAAATGVLSGTPGASAGGSYSLTFTATNSIGTSAAQNFTLTVNQLPKVTSAASTTFTVGTAGTFTMTASGYPAPTFSETGALPSGVTLSAAGVLSGTPAAGSGGVYRISVTASNAAGASTAQTFTLTVNQAPAITSAAAATFKTGTAGTFTVTASGYPAPTFTRTGTLPSGVTFATATGVLSGTPGASAGGSYSLTFTATNSIGTSAAQSFTLTVNQLPKVTSAASTTFTVGTAGTFTMTASGYPAPTFSETGALPSGVTLSAAGVLSGTPAAGSGGVYRISVTASNAAGASTAQTFTLTVNQAPAITSAASTTFTIGKAGTFTVTASGYPAPTFTETGALPKGVKFTASTGVLAGTPAAGTTGTYKLQFTASNSVGTNATQTFTLTVN